MKLLTEKRQNLAHIESSVATTTESNSQMTDEILSSQDIRHVARLAALRIDDDEVEMMRSQLSDILSHFQTLAELDTEGVPPTGHTTDAHSVMRDDDEHAGSRA